VQTYTRTHRPESGIYWTVRVHDEPLTSFSLSPTLPPSLPFPPSPFGLYVNRRRLPSPSRCALPRTLTPFWRYFLRLCLIRWRALLPALLAPSANVCVFHILSHSHGLSILFACLFACYFIRQSVPSKSLGERRLFWCPVCVRLWFPCIAFHEVLSRSLARSLTLSILIHSWRSE